MTSLRIPEWAIGTALCAVVALGATDLYMLRRHRVVPHARPVPDTIGLHATPEGEGLRVEWNRRGRIISNADHAVLSISDSTNPRPVELSGEQLDRASVLYYPQSDQVSFRLEVFRGGLSTSETIAQQTSHARRTRQAGRATIEKLRPSPFEHVQPEIVVTQYRPAPVVPARAVEPEAAAANPQPSSFERVLSKIPLLGRLSRHRDDE
ncbi:MAG: hypothetical protein ABI759_15725 [Candidatus Solibacter sp.]